MTEKVTKTKVEFNWKHRFCRRKKKKDSFTKLHLQHFCCDRYQLTTGQSDHIDTFPCFIEETNHFFHKFYASFYIRQLQFLRYNLVWTVRLEKVTTACGDADDVRCLPQQTFKFNIQRLVHHKVVKQRVECKYGLYCYMDFRNPFICPSHTATYTW